jgi:hypothetical protein
VPFYIPRFPTPHVGSPPSKRYHIHGSRASRLQRDTTSAAYARALTRAHGGATRSRRRGPCRASRREMVRTINKRTNNWHSTRTTKMTQDKGSRGGSPSLRVTPEPSSKKQQPQHLSPPSADDRATQGGLAGLAAKGARTSASSSSSSSPMSFFDAFNKAKATAETEKAREGMHWDPVHRPRRRRGRGGAAYAWVF